MFYLTSSIFFVKLAKKINYLTPEYLIFLLQCQDCQNKKFPGRFNTI